MQKTIKPFLSVFFMMCSRSFFIITFFISLNAFADSNPPLIWISWDSLTVGNSYDSVCIASGGTTDEVFQYSAGYCRDPVSAGLIEPFQVYSCSGNYPNTSNLYSSQTSSGYTCNVQCPENSTLINGVCTCGTGFKGINTLPPVVGLSSCQPIVCGYGEDFDATTNSCKPVVCPVLNVYTESQFCDNWHENVGRCRYNAQSITPLCSITGNNGEQYPSNACKKAGVLISGTPRNSPIDTSFCDAAPSSVPTDLNVELAPLTEAEKAKLEAANQRALDEKAKAEAEKAAQELLQTNKEVQRQLDLKAQEDAATAARQLAAQQAYQDALTKAQAASTAADLLKQRQKELEQAELNNQNNPTTANQQAVDDAKSQVTSQTTATTAAQTSATIAAQQSSIQAANAAQSSATSGASNGSSGLGSGDGKCGSFSCESTQIKVLDSVKKTNDLLSGVGTDSKKALQPLDSLNDDNNKFLKESLEKFNNLDLMNKFNDKFRSLLPVSPFSLIDKSANAECQLTFTLVNQTYTLSMCETLPYLHPAINFMLLFTLAIFLFNLAFERPRGSV